MNTSPSIFDQYRQSVAALPPPPTPNLAGLAGPTSPGGVPSNLNIPMPAAPKVTHAPSQLDKDKASYQQVKMAGPGEEQLYHKITGSQFGQNHPILGKVLGGLAAGVTGAADIGLGTLGGGIGRLAEEQIPGTLLNHQVQLNRAGKDITTDEAKAGKEAQTASENATAAKTTADTAEVAPEAEARIGQENATAANENSEVEHRGDVKDSWKEISGFTGANGEPLEINEGTGETRPASVPGGAKATVKESNPQQQTYDSLLKSGLTPMQAYEKIREKPGGTTINQGTWTLDEDPTTGKPVLFNSKTGETKAAPAGVAKAGTFAKEEAGKAPAKQAIEYADSYKSGIHTGPGDEALMEKFFELAKPSTGFRMSQPQIDMLKNARGWAGSLEGHLRHATTGTWFSDEQRDQIVGTMHDLAKAKGLEGDSQGAQTAAPQRPSGVPANYQWNPQGNGGKGSWRAPQ